MADVDITRVAGNMGATYALDSLMNINSQLALHQGRLATGKQINSSADDPAGMNMAITFNIRNQDMQTVLNSLGDAKNLLATSESGLSQINDLLTKMKTKANTAIGGTLGADEKAAIAKQLTQYAAEIDDVVSNTQWNGTSLLGAAGSSMDFLSGISAKGVGTKTTFTFSNTKGFNAVAGLSLKANYAATDLASGSINATVTALSAAIDLVKGGISDVGTMSARLATKQATFTGISTNTKAAYNRIMNANMADEQVQASQFMILQQTATAELAQANSAPQFLLKLFQ
jgi:flagellin